MPRPQECFCGVVIVGLLGGCPDFTGGPEGALDLGAGDGVDSSEPEGSGTGAAPMETTSGPASAEDEAPIPEPGVDDDSTQDGGDATGNGPGESTTVGVDDEGTDAAGSTTGGGDSDSSGSSTGESVDYYGPCTSAKDCEPDFLCLHSSQYQVGICGLPQCADVDACPQGPEGTTVQCDSSPVSNATPWCHLACGAEGECPTDTVCFDDNVCVFPFPS